VFDASAAGFGKVVFVCRPETLTVLQSSIAQRIAARIAVEYVIQRLGRFARGTGTAAWADEAGGHRPGCAGSGECGTRAVWTS